ncbi:MAG: 3-isopropylmalate dehydrogenase [Lachnospiraceae bacterium]|jgi:3-isopropylmalate dehydrogenase
MEYHIALIPGDGIGPEIVGEAKKVLDRVAGLSGHTFTYETLLMGGCSIDAYGEPLTAETLAKAKASDAVLLGAVGGKVGNSRWYDAAPSLRPEAGLLAIRKGLGLFANVRPARLMRQLKDACPLKESVSGSSFDIVIMRELTGGLYFGTHKTETVDGLRTATDELVYNEEEIRRIAVRAFEVAEKRRKHVTSVDKANVLDSSRLWRAVAAEVAKDYPDVQFDNMLVDNCAMQLVMNPGQFDVILTENMFGDILSDEASMITGSIGMLPSASLGSGSLGLYEPTHGSAPDIAGMNIANPIATILSAAMLLRYSLSLDAEASLVERAVDYVLDAGYRTPDIWSEGCTKVGTIEMGNLIADALTKVEA